ALTAKAKNNAARSSCTPQKQRIVCGKGRSYKRKFEPRGARGTRGKGSKERSNKEKSNTARHHSLPSFPSCISPCSPCPPWFISASCRGAGCVGLFSGLPDRPSSTSFSNRNGRRRRR